MSIFLGFQCIIIVGRLNQWPKTGPQQALMMHNASDTDGLTLPDSGRRLHDFSQIPMATISLHVLLWIVELQKHGLFKILLEITRSQLSSLAPRKKSCSRSPRFLLATTRCHFGFGVYRAPPLQLHLISHNTDSPSNVIFNGFDYMICPTRSVCSNPETVVCFGKLAVENFAAVHKKWHWWYK